MIKIWLGTICTTVTVMSAGCAGLNVQQLKPDLTPDGPPGIRYYLPKPYLVVTLLPADPSATTNNSGNGQPAQPAQLGVTPPPPAATTPLVVKPRAGSGAGGSAGAGAGGGAGAGAGGGAGGVQNPSNSNQSGTAAPASDTSFLASSAQYVVKLVYLPDYSHPGTITMTAGLFGSISAQPTLQDGWMLTGLQASADNTQIPQMLGTILSSVLGGSKAASTGGATGALPKGGGAPSILSDQMLEPGLYAFTTNAAGRINGVCLAQSFGKPNAVKPPNPCVAAQVDAH